MNWRKALLVVVALGIAILLFWLMRNRFQSRTEPMERAPTPAEQEELKNLLPPTEAPAPDQKKK